MKTRMISAIVALLIFIPVLLYGGFLYQAVIYVLALIGLKEFLNIKQTKKELPLFIQFISYVLLTLFIFIELPEVGITYALDFRLLAGLFLALLIPVVLFHESKLYSVTDAFYLIGGIFFLGSSFHLFILLRNIGLDLVVYLLLISILTDTYAYLTGSLIGRTKLLEVISPKKTWEGMIGGTLFGTLIPTYFYHLVIDPTIPIHNILLMSLFLSIIGQFGDLTFSAIKRYYGKKDFSNIMPGHGGILDRLDSIIFIVLGFMFFVTII